jgi:guanylate kinase
LDLKIIISSPSGAGKTTITRNLLKKVKNSKLSVSCTTRKPRPGEKHGTDYFFVSKKKFLELKKKNKFLETAKVFNNYYGTLKSEVISKKKNKIILLDIDWQGARIIRRKIKNHCHSFYLLPPNFKELKKRLFKRHQENIKIAEERISKAKNDIKHWSEYDEVFINKNINQCSKEIIKKIDLIRLNNKKKNFISNFVKKFKFK